MEYDYPGDSEQTPADAIRADPHTTLKYTFVALIGVLAGVILGSLWSQSGGLPRSPNPPVPHPRMLAPP